MLSHPAHVRRICLLCPYCSVRIEPGEANVLRRDDDGGIWVAVHVPCLAKHAATGAMQ